MTEESKDKTAIRRFNSDSRLFIEVRDKWSFGPVPRPGRPMGVTMASGQLTKNPWSVGRVVEWYTRRT